MAVLIQVPATEIQIIDAVLIVNPYFSSNCPKIEDFGRKTACLHEDFF
jgi:hypothetical protein